MPRPGLCRLRAWLLRFSWQFLCLCDSHLLPTRHNSAVLSLGRFNQKGGDACLRNSLQNARGDTYLVHTWTRSSSLPPNWVMPDPQSDSRCCCWATLNGGSNGDAWHSSILTSKSSINSWRNVVAKDVSGKVIHELFLSSWSTCVRRALFQRHSQQSMTHRWQGFRSDMRTSSKRNARFLRRQRPGMGDSFGVSSLNASGTHPFVFGSWSRRISRVSSCDTPARAVQEKPS